MREFPKQTKSSLEWSVWPVLRTTGLNHCRNLCTVLRAPCRRGCCFLSELCQTWVSSAECSRHSYAPGSCQRVSAALRTAALRLRWFWTFMSSLSLLSHLCCQLSFAVGSFAGTSYAFPSTLSISRFKLRVTWETSWQSPSSVPVMRGCRWWAVLLTSLPRGHTCRLGHNH